MLFISRGSGTLVRVVKGCHMEEKNNSTKQHAGGLQAGHADSQEPGSTTHTDKRGKTKKGTHFSWFRVWLFSDALACVCDMLGTYVMLVSPLIVI